MKDGKVIASRKEAKPEDAFWCELSVEEFTEDELKEMGKQLTITLFPIIKERVKSDIPALLSPANFYGEAEEYMFQNKIRFSKKRRSEYAAAIHQDFITNLDKTIVLDEQDGMIEISPYILSLQYGDFYRPAIQFLSNIIQKYLDEEYQKTR